MLIKEIFKETNLQQNLFESTNIKLQRLLAATLPKSSKKQYRIKISQLMPDGKLQNVLF